MPVPENRGIVRPKIAGVDQLQPAPRPSRLFKFGIFEADFEAGELRKAGMRQKLAGQPFQVLQLLLERPQEVVTREELQKSIWPKGTFVDYELALKKAVNRIREVLGDSADSPRFIETIPRRGYRFIAAVEEIGNGTRAAAAPALAATVDSIVVLPFTNLSPDPENEFFADGITEEIINALAQIKQLHVVARSSAFSFKGKHIDPRTVGEQLNVRTVLEGSVRKADNRLRITVQLVNAADGYHLWSERYESELKAIFDIQDDIARSVAEKLKIWLFSGKIGAPRSRPLLVPRAHLVRNVLSRLKIGLRRSRQEPKILDASEVHVHFVAGRLVKAGTENVEAYQLYVKGRILLLRRGPAVAYVDCFERAVRLDPNYAQAWAGLADSFTVLGYTGLAHPDATVPKAIEAARRAVALDPSLAEAHNAIAMASLMGTWDRTEAERGFLRALELNPRYIQARDWYALFYLMLSEGRAAEAMAEAKRALQSDPLSSYGHAMYSFICGCAREFAEAVQTSRRAVELDPESYLARFTLQEALRISRNFEESVAAGDLALAMSGRHSWSMTLLALTFLEYGRPADAEGVYAEMLARAGRQYVPPATLAVVASTTGRENEAVRHACEAFAIHDPHCQYLFSKYWPGSARLYAYPRFREIIASMGRSDWLRG